MRKERHECDSERSDVNQYNFVQNMTVFSYHQADKVPVQCIQARPDVCRERGVAADVFVPRAAAVGVRRGGAHRPGGPEDAHAIRRSVESVCSAAETRNFRGGLMPSLVLCLIIFKISPNKDILI